ncbi:unnamed protein product [Mytilus edulis]|uniref:Peptidase A2 domain-containing protein n=1 Tax=Mytilus edulis TaxID=6550 RepID=A0A8S3VDR9_MYTED|nr:unnamed protein product [Mytilus edulis]
MTRPTIKINEIKQCGLFAKVFLEIRNLILVDTGSAVTCISKFFYDKLKLKIKYEPISTTLVAASGGNLKVDGKVKLPFKIDGVSFEHDFVVVELDNMSGILGIDLLKTSEAQLNISKALVIMPDETVINLKKIQSNSCALIRLKERMLVPANTETAFKITVPKNMRENNMLIEPNAHLAKQGILIFNALVNAKDNKVVISALNCTDRDITLKN